jgi:hypothetical protein
MPSTHSPSTIGVPKDLLLDDFRQQCANLQGQYSRMHNRLQLLIGLSTALLPTFGAVALAASKGDVGRPWLILFPLTGLLLSAIGFVTGAADRELVTIYRDQLSWTAECLLSASTEGPSESQRWLHFGTDPAVVDRELGRMATEWPHPSTAVPMGPDDLVAVAAIVRYTPSRGAVTRLHRDLAGPARRAPPERIARTPSREQVLAMFAPALSR